MSATAARTAARCRGARRRCRSWRRTTRASSSSVSSDRDSTDARVREQRLRQDRSILDSVTARVRQLQQTLGPSDTTRLSDYLESLRDTERRIQKAEEQRATQGPELQQPAGVPDSFEPHVKLLFDLQLLAYQADLTRVITFMYGREQTGRPYPQIGI